MLNQAELKLFVKWCSKPQNFVRLVKFAIERIIKKWRFKRAVYGWPYYPKEIRNLVMECPCVRRGEHGQTQRVDPTNFRPNTLRLASTDCLLKTQNIDWRTQFNDPEDTESLHRFNWLITLNAEHGVSADLVIWATQQILNWSSQFLSELDEKMPLSNIPPRFETYTVGERISNIVVFYDLQKQLLPTEIFYLIARLAHFMLKRLEYRGTATGNHVFNNARGLYLAGVALNDENYCRLAKTIFRRELPQLLTTEGFLREGSSHYQFIFTRWLNDIVRFANLAGEKELSTWLEPFVTKAKACCDFFLPHYPLFGDISPDFTPEFVTHLVGAGSRRPSHNPQYGRGDPAPTINNFHRHTVHDFTLFLRADVINPPTHVGHHHNDVSHFALYYKDKPIFIDSGRLNYDMTDPRGVIGLTAAAHNTVLLDGIPPLPDFWQRFPRECCIATSNVEEAGDTVTFTTDGFSRLKKNTKLTRQFGFEKNQFIITDTIDGRGEHTITTYFHFASQIELQRHSKKKYDLKLFDQHGSFTIDTELDFTVEEFFNDAAGQGLCTVEYGKALPAHTIAVTTHATLPYRCRWRILCNKI